MLVSSSDLSVSARLAMDGFWEMWTTIPIVRFLEPGDYFIDIGANVGWFSALACELVGPTGRVVSYEPWSTGAYCMGRSKILHGAEHWRVHRAAISSCYGMCDLRDGRGGIQDSASFHITTSAVSGPHQVQAQPLPRDVFSGASTSAKTLIKIDVEGHEHEVWIGIQEALQQRPNTAIVLEWTPKLYPAVEGFWSELTAFGTVRRISETGTLEDIPQDVPYLDEPVTMLWIGKDQ